MVNYPFHDILNIITAAQDHIIYLKLKLACEGEVVVLASFHKSDYSV